MSVDVDTMSDRNATVASASIQLPSGERVTTTGSSKRERFDAYRRDVGEMYSTARALHRLAYELESRAKKIVDVDVPQSRERRVSYVLAELSKQADTMAMPAIQYPEVHGSSAKLANAVYVEVGSKVAKSRKAEKAERKAAKKSKKNAGSLTSAQQFQQGFTGDYA